MKGHMLLPSYTPETISSSAEQHKIVGYGGGCPEYCIFVQAPSNATAVCPAHSTSRGSKGAKVSAEMWFLWDLVRKPLTNKATKTTSATEAPSQLRPDNVPPVLISPRSPLSWTFLDAYFPMNPAVVSHGLAAVVVAQGVVVVAHGVVVVAHGVVVVGHGVVVVQE